MQVSELAQYSIKNPLKSPLLWGTYEVLYCSKPTAVGGPLKKGAGPVIAPGQVARQILEEPDTLINEVTFKTFGFIPGVSKQYGNIRPISGDTFIVSRAILVGVWLKCFASYLPTISRGIRCSVHLPATLAAHDIGGTAW